MSARPWFLLALALILTGARARANDNDEDDPPGKIDLSLLFVGTVKDGAAARGRAARTKDFVDFLATQFASVESVDRNQFDPSLANGVDVVLLVAHSCFDSDKDRLGVYVYDPNTNSWAAEALAVPDKLGGNRKPKNGFYDPELSAVFVHTAGDSRDDGEIWVYRYKRRPAGPPRPAGE